MLARQPYDHSLQGPGSKLAGELPASCSQQVSVTNQLVLLLRRSVALALRAYLHAFYMHHDHTLRIIQHHNSGVCKQRESEFQLLLLFQYLIPGTAALLVYETSEGAASTAVLVVRSQYR